MKIIVIGASGHVGRAAAQALEDRGHEVIRASRSTDPAVDTSDPASIAALFSHVGMVDGVVVAAGTVPFKNVTDLDHDDYLSGLLSKAIGQFDVVGTGLEYVTDNGSFTLTSGIIGREQVAAGAAAAAANGALESFVRAAATEMPRGIRINALSPDVLANAAHFHDSFPGHRPVTDAEVGRAVVLSAEGVETGRVLIV